MSGSKVKVAVRVRPMNRRELELNTKCVVEMEENQTVLHPPPCPNTSKADNRKGPKVFAFDHCFWSMDETNKAKYAGQEVVFKCLGEGILENAFQGYNACIFAYGQTGSGKSFSMMGSVDVPGLIPRLCGALFGRVSKEESESHTFKVEVSYMEIYNEKVRDLLDPKGSRHTLKVREHKVLGPYVDGLSQLAVTCFEDIESLMSEGNKSRTVAATNMNEESSRSHAVFSIILTQTLYDLQSGTSGEKVSKLSLVDLAGSERVSKTGAAGERLKEGSNINKSLTTLGLVISALADQVGGKGKNKFVPYRDSVLTWLLKDNLGGNSKTAMIATISPAGDNYEETLSTLRYADRAKRIVNHAVVNEDPNAKIIRELREEVEKLKEQLSQAEAMKAPELKEKLEESEKLIKDLTITWEEKLRKTEEIAQERQKQLESMGISLESSGIKVGDDKCFLVNLNADPALNELLVYYLKHHTRVGADESQDIQLCGIGIQPEHCVIDISADGDVTLCPNENARTCLNGAVLHAPNSLWHGDRILWGNNHFFRINLPMRKRRDKLKEYESEANREYGAEQDVETASEASSEPDYNYEFAQMEVMMKALSTNDPVQNVVQILEKQYLEEKKNALEEQRLMYERELELLRQQLSPDRLHRHGIERLSFTSQTAQQKVKLWSEERDQLFRHSLSKLREQIVKANALVREANFLAEEMNKQTDYQVTLQIPAANLSANKKRGAIVSEPAIQVRRKGKGTQVWPIEKLENKLIDMRDLYQDWKEKDMVEYYNKILSKHGDPFYEAQENHNLIGVANVFLECLYHDVKLQYAVPIISQQGEVAGRLHVEVMRVSGVVPECPDGGDDSSENSSGSYEVMDNNGEVVHMAKKLTCRVKIIEATGLPLNLSNFVFCQYIFWDHSDQTVAPPMVNPDMPPIKNKPFEYTVTFDHSKDFIVHVTEEFLEFISDGALAIEVWGHRCAGNGRTTWAVDALQAKTRTLCDRWSEVTRRIEMWISVQELNEMGEYTSVELTQAKDVNTGGVFQIRQGQSRRIEVTVKPVQHSGTLPLMVEAILSVSVGCITARSIKLQRPLDSYQEEDLNEVRERWSDALMKRREYLDEQIQKVINKPEKTEDDMEREARLVEQWVGLTEERNAVLVPAPGSGIPGAPADWISPPGMETHIPVLFLDLNADDLRANEQLTGPHAPGVNSILPKEHGSQFFYLPIIKHSEEEVSAIASWDSSVHDSIYLNKVTPQNERIYLIIKTTVQLSHPASVELVLRKRIAVNIYNKQSFTQSLKRRMSYKHILHSCGVTYEIVSNIPKASEEAEDRETLALMAAKSENDGSGDGETYIEKYTRGVLEVENILSLERLRQAVTLKEALSSKGRHMKRSVSTPNVHHVSSNRSELSGYEEDEYRGRSESHHDISDCLFNTQEHSWYNTLPKDSPRRMKDPGGAPPDSPHSLSPLKAFSPQPPKFLKSLMPVREERKGKQPLETKPLLAHEDSEEEDYEVENLNKKISSSQGFHGFQPYIPEDFADFDVYNASLENRDLFSSKPELLSSRFLENEVSRSPTASSMTSGYISHSASNATLSDVVFTGTENTDQLSNQTRHSDLRDTVAQVCLSNVKLSSEKDDGIEEQNTDLKDVQKNVSFPTNSALVNETSVLQQFIESKSILVYRTLPDMYSSNSLPCTLKPQGSMSEDGGDDDDFFNSTLNVDIISSQDFTDFQGAEEERKDLELPDELMMCSTGSSDNSNRLSVDSLELDEKWQHSAVKCVNDVSELPEDSCSMTHDQSQTTVLDNRLANTSENTLYCEEVDPEEAFDNAPNSDNSVSRNLSDLADIQDSATAEQGEPLPSWITLGERVSVGNDKNGTIRYVGTVDFSTGIWVGVELDFPAGKHQGTIEGKEYFHCSPRCGIFVRPNRLIQVSNTIKQHSSTFQTQTSSSHERQKVVSLGRSQVTSSTKPDGTMLHQSEDAAPSKKQNNRKSWVN
ncbi:kinesin-like protein KIF13A isoform X8 [Chiloscyllium plagiosum]|uniref:kinesin-like protein KIF13A isoform X8 n=1 Tax=Chiloscyllium plagiosum TaxID=36176 RepID=UPI001CB7B11E|nr:kinesin-like protein KIF13A isoform X8 [Chiloscyllium plagiosum]